MPASPGASPEQLTAALLTAYGVCALTLDPLVAGEDAASAYRVGAAGGDAYFLKLRRTAVPSATLAIAAALHAGGITNVVAPLPSRGGALAVPLGPATAILSPFIRGGTAYDRRMDEDGWRRFGALLRRVHTSLLPARLTHFLEREDFAATWIADARTAGESVAALTPRDQIGSRLAARWRERRSVIERLVDRAARLAARLRAAPPPLVLCHADIHLRNLMIDDTGDLWIVDWDDVRLAPKECDLIFGIGGIVADTVGPRETRAFLDGYGDRAVDAAALAFYRHHRALTDIAAYTREALATDATEAERAHALVGFDNGFLAGCSVDLALAAPVACG